VRLPKGKNRQFVGLRITEFAGFDPKVTKLKEANKIERPVLGRSKIFVIRDLD
jgi:hypothetical protein